MRPFIQFSSRFIQKCNEFYLAFHIDEDWFAANFPRIAGFSKDYKFEPVNNSNSFVIGNAIVNNECLPVIDLKKKIGMNNDLVRNTERLIVIETEVLGNKLKFAIFYDTIGDAFEVSSKRILPTPNIGKYFTSGNIKGIHIHEEQCVMLLDFKNVFSLDDLIDIKIASAQTSIPVLSE
jgi:chemotaxis signal transduction protein